MRQSKLFPSTRKQAPTDAQSINHKLLVQAGFIDQLMAGSWTLLPLGQAVVTKIENIIKEELNKIGSQEILMPLLHPKSIWNETGRWDTASEIMYKLTDVRKKDFTLSFTHEEIFLDLVRKQLRSYQDLPIALYHFSTKFRNELRARSGILRGREFLMKDLYSLHADEKGLDEFYWQVADAYKKIFKRIGFDFYITEAGGGVFTDRNTHEFQVVADGGEDTIYVCNSCDWAQNQEIFELKAGDSCPKCKKGEIKELKSIEVGNIFRFGTYYSEKMNVSFTDENGDKKYPYFGSYGIGTSRVMGAWVETSHDSKGIIWPESISPFTVHLIKLPGGDNAEKIYNTLIEESIEVLYDDRDISAGEKFVDSDLIGIPIRLVASRKTESKIEYKYRNSDEAETLSLNELLGKLKK